MNRKYQPRDLRYSCDSPYCLQGSQPHFVSRVFEPQWKSLCQISCFSCREGSSYLGTRSQAQSSLNSAPTVISSYLLSQLTWKRYSQSSTYSCDA